MQIVMQVPTGRKNGFNSFEWNVMLMQKIQDGSEKKVCNPYILETVFGLRLAVTVSNKLKDFYVAANHESVY